MIWSVSEGIAPIICVRVRSNHGVHLAAFRPDAYSIQFLTPLEFGVLFDVFTISERVWKLIDRLRFIFLIVDDALHTVHLSGETFRSIDIRFDVFLILIEMAICFSSHHKQPWQTASMLRAEAWYKGSFQVFQSDSLN